MTCATHGEGFFESVLVCIATALDEFKSGWVGQRSWGMHYILKTFISTRYSLLLQQPLGTFRHRQLANHVLVDLIWHYS